MAGGELHEISAAIGELRADVKHVHDCVHRLDGSIGALQTDMTAVRADMNVDQKELAKLKAKGAGLLLAVSFASGLTGANWSAIKTLLFGHGS